MMDVTPLHAGIDNFEVSFPMDIRIWQGFLYGFVGICDE